MTGGGKINKPKTAVSVEPSDSPLYLVICVCVYACHVCVCVNLKFIYHSICVSVEMQDEFTKVEKRHVKIKEKQTSEK